ncbi:MAG: hypothetical protein IK138_09750 [Lachnospiraceae bacterium]|nr:hypothetical protein [Lachnospiraceae bacterium]
MREKNSHKLWKRISKLVAVTLALVLIVGVLPASAASNEIVVKTKKQLVKAMESKSAATIIFRTNRKTRFIIPEIANSANKKLIMEAPNARAFNKATFKTITLNKSEYFNERGNDNSLYIKGDGIKLTVSKGIEAKKVSITATDIIVKVASNGNVGDIILNKKKAEVTVAVAKNAEANITVKKQADLTVEGDKTADITIVSQAADTKITATAPVDIVAEKDADVVLEKGSEGSTVESSKEVDVDISGAAEKQATVTEDGKVVQEAEPAKEEKKEETKKDTTPSTDTTTPASDSGQSYVTPVTPTTEDTGKVQVRFAFASGGTVVVKLDNGKTLYSGDKVATGSSIKIVLSPADGKQGAVSINDGAGTLEGSGAEWTVTNIVTDLTITVTFKSTSSGAATPAAISLTLKAGNITSGSVASGTAIGIVKFDVLDSSDIKWATVTIASGTAISSATASDITVTLESAKTESASEVTTLAWGEMGDFNKDVIKSEIKKKFPNAQPSNQQ